MLSQILTSDQIGAWEAQAGEHAAVWNYARLNAFTATMIALFDREHTVAQVTEDLTWAAEVPWQEA